jgi:hypothetical protein
VNRSEAGPIEAHVTRGPSLIQSEAGAPD